MEAIVQKIAMGGSEVQATQVAKGTSLVHFSAKIQKRTNRKRKQRTGQYRRGEHRQAYRPVGVDHYCGECKHDWIDLLDHYCPCSHDEARRVGHSCDCGHQVEKGDDHWCPCPHTLRRGFIDEELRDELDAAAYRRVAWARLGDSEASPSKL
jgi:hypothetical protein